MPIISIDILPNEEPLLIKIIPLNERINHEILKKMPKNFSWRCVYLNHVIREPKMTIREWQDNVDSALIDRFHGFIKGWDVPRMNEDMKVKDWALNTEYFSEIMHALREDVISKALVDELIEVPKDADTRDTKAVKRITTAYMKLLFPHWTSVDEVNKEDFKKYCLNRAVEMRKIIKTQLGIMDTEFRKRPMQEYKLKGE